MKFSKSILLLLSISFTRFCIAQQDISAISKIISAEYFFDKDPGVGQGTKLSIGTADTTISFADSIPASSLQPGYHTLCIRVKNAAKKWSIFQTKTFYVRGTNPKEPAISKIISAEYFFDKDPGVGQGTKLSIGTADTTISFADSIPASSLQPGYHTLCIRVKNAAKKWSIFQTKTFYVRGTNPKEPTISKITAAEYFFDNDPGVGSGIPLKINKADTVISFADSVTFSALYGKDHAITVRVKNSTGEWSIFQSWSFSFIYADADRDGILDYEEVKYGTNYKIFDTNNDGLADGVNVFTNSNPLDNDTDSDGIPNGQEQRNGTIAIAQDTDGDGVTDKKDAFPLDPHRTKLPPKNLSDHSAPVIILNEPPL